MHIIRIYFIIIGKDEQSYFITSLLEQLKHIVSGNLEGILISDNKRIDITPLVTIQLRNLFQSSLCDNILAFHSGKGIPQEQYWSSTNH